MGSFSHILVSVVVCSSLSQALNTIDNVVAVINILNKRSVIFLLLVASVVVHAAAFADHVARQNVGVSRKFEQDRVHLVVVDSAGESTTTYYERRVKRK